jgi:CMP/dCMP kinase
MTEVSKFAEPHREAAQPPASPPTARKPIIAIDGPAGAGKSTVARHLASYFGLLNLESGAMYRAFALKALGQGIDLEDMPALVALSKATTIHLEPAEEGNRVFLDGQDVTSQLREPAVTDGASRVSVHPPIRTWMVRLQQELGAQGGVVMEGRDIGTVVFPQADVKIFLDAAPEVRGLRRYDQMDQTSQTGQASNTQQPEAIVRELRARDERDRNRADSPLRPAQDAILVDSTRMTLEEVVARAEAIVEEKLAQTKL